MTVQPVTCASCGAKLSSDRRRCPRCRALLATPDPAAAAASRKLASIFTAIVGVLVLAVAGVWLMREPEPTPHSAATQPVPDLVALRRPASQPGDAPVPAPPNVDRAFLDPPGAAAVAYAAGNMASALQHYQAALERNPNDAESLSNLGQVLVRLNRLEEALPYFERAIALIPDRWAYTFNLARALGALGRWEESVAAYRRAQVLFPNDYATAFNLALALRKAEDDAGALVEFQKAIALEPNDATFRIALGMTYERLQKPADAADAYEEALRLAPQAPDAEAVRGRIAQLRGSSGG